MVWAALVCAPLAGCDRWKKEPPPPPLVDLVSPDGTRPVYALFEGPPDPVTKKLCDALASVPETRRAACCSTPPGPTLAADCFRALGAAVRAKAVSLVAAEVDACAAAMDAAWAGCDWVGPHSPSMPVLCQRVIHGQLAEKTHCRSSLECRPGLRCLGVNDDLPGICAPPEDNGGLCGPVVDALANVTLQDTLAAGHPACAGHCERRLCATPISPGGPCAGTAQCDSGHHCGRQRCQVGAYAALDEDCSGTPCAPDARCVRNKCARPLIDGAPCEADEECRGACLKQSLIGMAGLKGVCGKSCEKKPGGQNPSGP